MRNIILAAAMAIGLVILWAAILPLTAQPAPAQSPAMSKALFLCRHGNTIDRACAAALAQALVLDDPKPVVHASSHVCRESPETVADLERRH